MEEQRKNGHAQKIALFGGSFDPPHVAHQMACLYAREVGKAHQVWMVPCALHPFGKPLTPFEHRVAMCGLAACGLKGVDVSRVEEDLPGPNRTLDTVRHLYDNHPGFRFMLVVGSDILKETHKWYGWDELVKLVDLLVVGRSGWGSGDHDFKLPDVSSSSIRRRLSEGLPVDHLVPGRVLDYIRKNRLYSKEKSPF